MDGVVHLGYISDSFYSFNVMESKHLGTCEYSSMNLLEILCSFEQKQFENFNLKENFN